MHESESERAWRRLARRRKDTRWLLPSREQRGTFPCPCTKEERRGKETRARARGKMGSLWKFLLSSKTVMHVSPISVTERLLAAFCPRDNSLPFFIAALISQLKNYSRKVGTLRQAWRTACSGYWSENKIQI